MLKRKGKIKNPVIFNNVNECHAALLVFSSRNKLKLPFSSVLSPTGRLFNFFFFLAKGGIGFIQVGGKIEEIVW